MTTPMEAYKQLILQDTNADPVFGVHKISEKTNYRWKAGFLAGYAAGQREALLEAADWFDPSVGGAYPGEIVGWNLRRMAKELE